MSFIDSGLNFDDGSITTGGMKSSNNNKDLEDFLMLEREKAKMTAQVSLKLLRCKRTTGLNFIYLSWKVKCPSKNEIGLSTA